MHAVPARLEPRGGSRARSLSAGRARVVTLFCSDIDGTLLNAERTLSARTVAAIRAVIEAGHLFVLCSSRMPASMEILERLYGGTDVPLIAYNGGLVLRRDRSVALDVRIPAEDARHVQVACERLGLHASHFAGDEWHAWGPDKWSARETMVTGVAPGPLNAHEYVASGRVDVAPPHKVMAMGEPAAIDALAADLAERSAIVTYRSKDTYLEIASAACSKGEGLRAVAGALGIDLADTCYFGDNFNDLSAFAVAGTAVAVAGARPEVLAAATVVTEAHVADGVAQYLEQWLAGV